MDNFTKEFTVVDFLGILLPGAFLILMVNHGANSLNLWNGYFGESCGDTVKGILLIVAGYVVGSLLHEIADWMERLLWFLLDRIHNWHPASSAAANVGRQALYEEAAKMALPGTCQDQTAAEWQDAKTFRQSVQAIQTFMTGRKGSSKIRLFKSFNIMMRNLVAAMLLSAFYFIIFGNPEAYPIGCKMIVIGAVVIVVALVRAYHYAYLSYKYLFENFLNERRQG